MNTTIQPEFRTPEQIRVDEMVAAGDWSEFGPLKPLTTEEAAVALLEARKTVPASGRAAAAVVHPAGGIADQPFLWNGRPFRVLRAVFDRGRADVEVSPADAEFEAELRRRIETDRFHTLGYYQGFGYVCFPEDYAKYQG